MFDAIVIGGSFAGLSATMYLARSRRRVLLIDAGKPRNRFTEASHGFLGQDGKAPATIRATGRAELAAYDNVAFLDGEALDARSIADGFAIAMADGREERARRLVLATGVTDILPEIDGLAERWGRSVLHCPFCHGYEYRDRPLGVLATGPMSSHQGELIPDWGPTTYFTQGEFEPTPEELARFAARGVTVERSPVVALLGTAPMLEAVRLADGRTVELAALFTGPRLELTSPIAERLGCDLLDGLQGPVIEVDAQQQTTVAGVFAAGDAATQMHSALLASSAGMMAGVCAYRSLVF
ncbi:NAD(P)/FAD-dependent oxidoreductase [Oricola sp.]|uniref:NAD(P)/FAD-dependent oxidoreductase n=1 Tax=Oricola sp. TaxID=1979950 RepID=UPI0025CC9684|nr:NAD(P)/FAD-dependent oxidoreductase [Oricola sp.]MCI5076788.1 NAD(P)/FAD-dependent oxidoreductase [Oricola sp.]